MKRNTLLTDQDVKERSLIWDYFRINAKDDKKFYASLAVSLSVTGEPLLKTSILVTCDTIYSELTSLSLKN